MTTSATGPGTMPPGRRVAQALDLYYDLHRHPELSGAEARTAAEVADRLRSLDLEVTTGIGGHGVAATLRNGAGPTVLVRAELDALPVREQTGLSYASTVTGTSADGSVTPVMHACGHDLHLAAMIGAAGILADQRAAWAGTLVVVGQPAEETLLGARAMLADGLYQRFGRPDAVLAQHTAPLPAGMVAHGDGPMLAGSATLRLTVHGRGGHAGAAYLHADPVPVAAAIVLALGRLASDPRPGTPASVTVGRLRAGETANVVPDQATMDVTVRAPSAGTVEWLVAEVHRIAREHCEAAGDRIHPELQELARSPATHPEPGTAARVREVHERVFGSDRVASWPPSLATDDFPYFATDGVATAYWMLGSVGPQDWAEAPGRTAAEKLAGLPGNHSPRFRPAAALALPAGITALVSAVRAILDEGRSGRPYDGRAMVSSGGARGDRPPSGHRSPAPFHSAPEPS